MVLLGRILRLQVHVENVLYLYYEVRPALISVLIYWYVDNEFEKKNDKLIVNTNIGVSVLCWCRYLIPTWIHIFSEMLGATVIGLREVLDTMCNITVICTNIKNVHIQVWRHLGVRDHPGGVSDNNIMMRDLSYILKETHTIIIKSCYTDMKTETDMWKVI